MEKFSVSGKWQYEIQITSIIKLRAEILLLHTLGLSLMNWLYETSDIYGSSYTLQDLLDIALCSKVVTITDILKGLVA